MALKEYEVDIQGVKHVLQLDEKDAKRYDSAVEVKTKAAAAPANKQAGAPANKRGAKTPAAKPEAAAASSSGESGDGTGDNDAA